MQHHAHQSRKTFGISPHCGVHGKVSWLLFMKRMTLSLNVNNRFDFELLKSGCTSHVHAMSYIVYLPIRTCSHTDFVPLSQTVQPRLSGTSLVHPEFWVHLAGNSVAWPHRWLSPSQVKFPCWHRITSYQNIAPFPLLSPSQPCLCFN